MWGGAGDAGRCGAARAAGAARRDCDANVEHLSVEVEIRLFMIGRA